MKHTYNYGLWYAKPSTYDLCAYSDADFAGSKEDRKSTSGACFFLGSCLVSWHCKKQHSIALSTAEAEYIAAGLSVAQILWMQNTLKDYGYIFSKTPLYCDSTSAVNISKNPILHSRTKHIEIKYHFIREQVQIGKVDVQYISTDQQLSDIFTKPLSFERFSKLRLDLGVVPSPFD